MTIRHIPDNATLIEFPAAKLTAYEYTFKNLAALLVYHGRKSKPVCHATFQGGEAARERFLAGTVRQYEERERAANERRTATHTFKLGDVLYSTWGYEQTNVDFYQVVAVPSGRSVVLRKLCADVKADGTGAMSGRATPRWGEFEPGSQSFTRRATGPDSVSGGEAKSYMGDLQRWDGKPRPVTSYA
jgi:hypothetical protein